jgi:hypothetical protein
MSLTRMPENYLSVNNSYMKLRKNNLLKGCPDISNIIYTFTVKFK